MINTISKTNFKFPYQSSIYKGKVRDVYTINDEFIVMIATDRLSAFDVILPYQIPYKGQVLNQISVKMMESTSDIAPNWLISNPDENVSVGYLCEPFKVEMVIRGYLSGHAAREYSSGKRQLCDVKVPNGLRENDKFTVPIITPTIKANKGKKDEDTSREVLLSKGIISEEDYTIIENYTKNLFKRGTELAEKKGLILADTKYEFGKTKDGKIVLIDEIHTPDSSRYFHINSYEEKQSKGEPQIQLSKEFIRQWLIANNFQGKSGQQIPKMSEEKIIEISNLYIKLYEQITGEVFQKAPTENILNRVEKNCYRHFFNLSKTKF